MFFGKLIIINSNLVCSFVCIVVVFLFFCNIKCTKRVGQNQKQPKYVRNHSRPNKNHITKVEMKKESILP